MSRHAAIPGTKTMLFAAALSAGMLILPTGAQSVAPAQAPKPAMSGAPARSLTNRFSSRALMYYQAVWGVDSLRVKRAESGEIIRFSWRVVDLEKAKPLNDKQLQPSLIDRAAGVALVVPSLEKVGQLRQTSAPVEGKSYWMAFSNPGRRVKASDRVSVVIGTFHADGLVVE